MSHRAPVEWAVIAWTVLLVALVALVALGAFVVLWFLLLVLSGWIS